LTDVLWLGVCKHSVWMLVVVLGAGVAFDLKRGGCLIVLCFFEPWEEEWWFCVVF